MQILNQSFSTGQVIAASGVSNATLQSWLKRNVIVGHKDHGIEGGGSPGRYRQFSYFNVMEIATAKALIDCGISDLGFAFGAAREFSHSGGGAFMEIPDRNPGLPFDTSDNAGGRTLLCVSGDKHHVAYHNPESNEHTFDDVLADIRQSLGSPLGFTILDMNLLFDRVIRELGHHPEKVLEAVYSPGWRDGAMV